MKEIKEFIEKLKGTSSRIAKMEILKSATQDEKELLEFLCNPYKITGIGKKKLDKQEVLTCVYDEASWKDLLEYFETHKTGSQLDVDFVRQVAGKYGDEYKDLIYGIARKDITLGISGETLNKVYGKGFIPTFSVQLAMSYYDAPEKLVKDGDEFVLTEKLDGVRCVCMFEYDVHKGYVPLFYTRSGRQLEGLSELEEETKKLNPSFVYDGELLIGEKGKSNEQYRKTMSIVGSDREKTGIVFNVFDCVMYDAFKAGKDETPYKERRVRLAASGADTEHIKQVPVLYRGKDLSQIEKWHKNMTAGGAEGVMINLVEAPYICARVTGLLKVKKFKECEGIVRAVEVGGGRNAGKLGSLQVEIKDKDGNMHHVAVGSGFSDEERVGLYANPQKVVGKVIDIGYFEVTKNKEETELSLRFPTWLGRVRLDKDEESMTPVV